MRPSTAGGLHNAAQEPLGAGTHVHRRGAQPQPFDADHLSRPEDSSLSQARQSSAAALGQRTLKCSGPRRSSIWISAWAVDDDACAWAAAPIADPLIQIELRRGPLHLSVRWPSAAAQDCRAWLSELSSGLLK